MKQRNIDSRFLSLATAILLAMSGATSSFSSDPQVALASNGNRLQVCNHGRAYCEVDVSQGTVTLSPTVRQLSGVKWKVKLPGELRHFAVNDMVDFAYFATTAGLYNCSLKAGDSSIIPANFISLPTSFHVDLLQIEAVAGQVALVLSHDTVALFSPLGHRVLHKVAKSYSVQATARSKVIMYAQGADSDMQMLIVDNDLSKTFWGTRITTYGDGYPFPLLRLLETSDGAKTYAGIVSYPNSPGDIKGDALMVWINGTVLDIDRSENFSECVAMAVYDRNVCGLFAPKTASGNLSARIVNWQISLSRGLMKVEEKIVNLGERPSMLKMNPTEPSVLTVSSDAKKLSYFGLELQLATGD